MNESCEWCSKRARWIAFDAQSPADYAHRVLLGAPGPTDLPRYACDDHRELLDPDRRQHP